MTAPGAARPVDLRDAWRERRTTAYAMFALVVLVAFESFAVTTVMPQVATLLDGRALYAFAFAGPLATGVVGMVVAGTWADRRGPAAGRYRSRGLAQLWPSPHSAPGGLSGAARDHRGLRAASDRLLH